ncbi:MAG: Hsp70 family protein [Syntrophomonadaceae bacterium]|jgi:molecular chaperone DnaK
MHHYIGIDLGTTNSAICSFDGVDTRIWKSPEQNDVTPSVFYIDRRGNKYFGQRAYNAAPRNPNNAASLFKRFMGTRTPIKLSGANLTFSPEECSAEVLKVLFGYLPEEIRNSPDIGTVITVPAAFNQMQKEATMQATEMAGMGKVALMQEPVAAVMSAMRHRKGDGMFLIYDLGGGTLDVAIAESINSRISLHANGGIAMCGGRDFDRAIFDNVVKGWLFDNFNLPEDLSGNPNYATLLRLAVWATERAKIDLSSTDEAVISLTESDIGMRDLSGDEIYIDIPLSRSLINKLISDKVDDSIEAAREVINKARVSAQDIKHIVFVGGPTNYKPLRDKVSFELGIAASSTEVNPMVVVAEGASVFAESIDWSTKNRRRKDTRGHLSSKGALAVSFNYIARTPDTRSKIGVVIKDQLVPGFEFEITSMDTGWTSGRMSLRHGVAVEVNLPKAGDNIFKVSAFDSKGGPISLETDKIIITRTAATISGIPASHSIGVEVLDKLGGSPVMDWLIKAGEPLPFRGLKAFKAGETLKGGSANSLKFKLWEGDIEDPVNDNRPIGMIKIEGSDFEGVIPTGADLLCEYEILDSGNIVVEVSVPSVGATFNSKQIGNFYSRQGEPNYNEDCQLVIDEGNRSIGRLNDIEEQVDDHRLEKVRDKLDTAADLNPEEQDHETIQGAMENVYQARRLLAQVRRDHLPEIRQMDLDHVSGFFDKYLREFAKPSEEKAFDNLVRSAQRAIDKHLNEFDRYLSELKGKNWEVLWRQDWFVIEQFKNMAGSSHMFTDKQQFTELVSIGTQLLKDGDINKLRMVTAQLGYIRMRSWSEEEILEMVNIVRG